jgi:broad specificity phosphatase PhoE
VAPVTDDNGSARVVLVRHGATEWSVAGRHTGRTDVPLLEEGRRQAEGLAPRLSGAGFRKVLTSPLVRARETCRLAGFGDRGEQRDDLREWDYGDYEGLTTGVIRDERPGWTLWSDGAPGGESAKDVAERADRVIEELRASEGSSLVFAHGHLLRVLTARWLGLAPEDGRLFVLDPATVSVLGYERETPAMLRWNDPGR